MLPLLWHSALPGMMLAESTPAGAIMQPCQERSVYCHACAVAELCILSLPHLSGCMLVGNVTSVTSVQICTDLTDALDTPPAGSELLTVILDQTGKQILL